MQSLVFRTCLPGVVGSDAKLTKRNERLPNEDFVISAESVPLLNLEHFVPDRVHEIVSESSEKMVTDVAIVSATCPRKSRRNDRSRSLDWYVYENSWPNYSSMEDVIPNCLIQNKNPFLCSRSQAKFARLLLRRRSLIKAHGLESLWTYLPTTDSSLWSLPTVKQTMWKHTNESRSWKPRSHWFVAFLTSVEYSKISANILSLKLWTVSPSWQ